MTAGTQSSLQFTGRVSLMSTCVLVVFLVAMTITIANVSLPQIQGSLSATRDQVAWVITAYLVANAVGLPATSWLTDRFGVRRLMVVGILGFTILTLLCATAPNLEILVIFRAGQGLISAPLTPLTMALVLGVFPRHQHGIVIAVFGIGVTIGPIIAPWLGGYLTEEYGWRSVFYFCLPFAVMASAAVLVVIPKDSAQRRRRLDLQGFVYLSVAIACFQLMVDRGERNDWFESVETTLEFLVGSASFYLFIVHSYTTRQPYIDMKIFANRDFAFGLILVVVFGMLAYSPTVLLPNMLQHLRGYPEELIGMVLAIRGLGMTIGFVILIWGSRLDPRIWLVLGFGLQVLSGLAMAAFDINVTNFELAWTGFVSGLGIGFLWVPLTVVTLGHIPMQQLPLSTSIFHLLRLFGSSIHISLSVALAIRTSKMSFAEIAERLVPGRPALANLDPTMTAQQALPMIREIGRQAELIGYINAFFFYGLTALLAMPLILLVRKPQIPG
jgi:DHA2 family multidrug resistance protein